MAQNALKLNDTKTDFVIFGTKHNLEKCSNTPITIGGCNITPSNSVKNIGATMDKHLKLDKQVNLTCRSAWYNLYQLGKLKCFLSEE